MSDVYAKLKELGLELPKAPAKEAFTHPPECLQAISFISPAAAR